MESPGILPSKVIESHGIIPPNLMESLGILFGKTNSSAYPQSQLHACYYLHSMVAIGRSFFLIYPPQMEGPKTIFLFSSFYP
jgi:hypothetical protein